MAGSMPNPTINKVALAVTKLQGREDWRLWSAPIRVALGQTWGYVDGSNPPPPDDANSKDKTWSVEDHNAHRRLFLASSDKVKETVLLHIDSHASKLFSVLKSQFEASSISAEFYTKQSYENAKLSNYNMIGNFITALTNLAHVF